ncbi:Oidioi.mRNA.OKI2018_I69.chr1.g3824.t1.cds [Oikopleura dioica]|uniref:Oidioi.mRNA.OKI2018_I69.chr1.g3824.t1.cds n=1 Tax=Oikopleura dioica TaxID=34765 RepID=A0ABN7SZL8_OIKDI|nr:Oidioi.mRNA.OKI2018_I69.chr1.g3824.t1.cds [Oikopleura dioica]
MCLPDPYEEKFARSGISNDTLIQTNTTINETTTFPANSTLIPETTTAPTVVPPQEWYCDDLGYNTCIRLMHTKKKNFFAGLDCARQESQLLRIYDERYLDFILDIREKVGAGDEKKIEELSEMWVFYHDMTEEVNIDENGDIKAMDQWVKPLTPEFFQKLSAGRKKRGASEAVPFGSLNYDERFETWDDLEGNWAEDQPNNNGNQDCVYLDADGKYNDFWCDTKELLYFCQKRPGDFHHIYHQKFPDAFDVEVLNNMKYCNEKTCKFFAKGNDTNNARTGEFKDAESWLNFEPLNEIISRPYYFKLAYGSGDFITWSQLQNPLEIEDDAEITPSDLTFYPKNGVQEFGKGFRTCDGIFFSGLRRSSKEGVFLDGTEGEKSFYQIGMDKEAIILDPMTTRPLGFAHVFTFPMHEPRYIINPDDEIGYEECWDRNKIRNELKRAGAATGSRNYTRFSRLFRHPGYRSDMNPIQSVDLFVSESPFPSHGSLHCHSLFSLSEHSVSVDHGYQCLKPKPFTTPKFTSSTLAPKTEEIADRVADVVSKKASTASAGGGIAGAAVGTLALQFLPKLYDPAKKQFKKAKDWPRGS